MEDARENGKNWANIESGLERSPPGVNTVAQGRWLRRLMVVPAFDSFWNQERRAVSLIWVGFGGEVLLVTR